MPEHSLDDIVHSIQSAVIAATDIAERHELDSIMNQEFWEQKVDDSGDPVTDDDGRHIYAPRMVIMEIPTWEDGILVQKSIPVPLQSLTTGQSLRVDNLEVEMSVEISGLEADKKKIPNLYKGILSDLQNAFVTTDMKVSTANYLIGYAETANVKFESDSFVLKLYEIFGR